MIHTKLYKKYYPFTSDAAVHGLSEDEKQELISWISAFPGDCRYWVLDRCLSRKINLGTFSPEVSGYKLKERCAELNSKIESNRNLCREDIDDINVVLYAQRHCKLLSFFICPFG